MIDRDLLKHRAEFKRALANHQYERTEDGIYFPKQHALAQGLYTHDVNGLDVRQDKNIITDEGLAYLLDTGLHDQARIGTWYFALFSANTTPLFSWDGATFTGLATEITSGTEGYSETYRQTFVEAAAVESGAASTATASITNDASKAAFTIVTASSLTVRGVGLLSTQAQGNTAGKLFSAARFSADRTLYNTDTFNVGYSVTLSST